MTRQIHRIDSTSDNAVALIETASSGGSPYARPVTLQTVSFAPSDAERLISDARIAKNPRFTVLETWKVDSRSQGPKSGYGKTKAAMLKELPGHLPTSANGERKRNVATIANPSPEDLQKFRAEVQALQIADAVPRRQTPSDHTAPGPQPKVEHRPRF